MATFLGGFTSKKASLHSFLGLAAPDLQAELSKSVVNGSSFRQVDTRRILLPCRLPNRFLAVQASAKAGQKYDYDLVIIGCGVGGHGAALHAVECVRYKSSH